MEEAKIFILAFLASYNPIIWNPPTVQTTHNTQHTRQPVIMPSSLLFRNQIAVAVCDCYRY